MSAPKLSEEGTIVGGVLLIAGCSIGAGMLGLPVLSAAAGFIPTFALFFLCWLFMASTGLLLLEVNLMFKEDVSIISMAGKTIGKWGQAVAWCCFLFLFYSLMVAYIAGSGVLVTEFFKDLFGYDVPAWVGGLSFVVIFGGLIYIGTYAVDEFNRILMFGLIASYFILVGMGILYIKPELLLHSQWKSSLVVIPAMIISFGYHNLVPSLTTYLHHNVSKLRWTILIGSAVPLFVYLVWEALVLGIVPLDGFQSALDNGEMATQSLKEVLGSAWIIVVAQYFAFFAILTSFLGIALSLVDFLADGLHIKKTGWGKVSLCLMTLLPPFIFSITYPGLFLTALNYAGGFGAVILFGVLPVLMSWVGRYQLLPAIKPILPGGKFALIMIMIISICIISLQLVQELGIIDLRG